VQELIGHHAQAPEQGVAAQVADGRLSDRELPELGDALLDHRALIVAPPGGEGVGANNLEVDVEETFAPLQIRDEILAALDGSGVPGTVGGAQGVLAGFDANRLNFIGGPNSGATVLEIIDVDTNSNNILRPVANVDGFPPTGPMQFQIDFLLQNNDRQLRDRIIAAINQELGAGTAETRGQSNAIFLDQNAGLNSFSGATSQPPFLLVGEAPGGNLTGMSFIGGRLFAVADTGALFEIVGPGGGGAFNANSTQATLDFIDQINDEFGAPIAFSGVTLGPQNVQDGAFSEMLFSGCSNEVLLEILAFVKTRLIRYEYLFADDPSRPGTPTISARSASSRRSGVTSSNCRSSAMAWRPASTGA